MENIIFQELPPAASLREYIQTYWHGNFNVHGESQYTQSVLPNGCIELIIHLTTEHCFLFKREAFPDNSPDITLIGLYDTPYNVSFRHNVHVFGIRFTPDGFRNITGIPPVEFGKTFETGQDVIGKDLDFLYQELMSGSDVAEQVQAANKFFLKMVEKNGMDRDYTHIAMDLMRSRKGFGEYEEVIREVPISLRQLQREFKKLYGISPKEYMRMLRINAVQHYMRDNMESSLTTLSFDMDFADQSHFIREFKAFANTTPGRFEKRMNQYILHPGY